MIHQPTIPNYLPAVNRQLEYQAGLLTTTNLTTASIDKTTVARRPWLGADFTHIIVAR